MNNPALVSRIPVLYLRKITALFIAYMFLLTSTFCYMLMQTQLNTTTEELYNGVSESFLLIMVTKCFLFSHFLYGFIWLAPKLVMLCDYLTNMLWLLPRLVERRKNKGMTSVISSLVRIWKISHSYPGCSRMENTSCLFFGKTLISM